MQAEEKMVIIGRDSLQRPMWAPESQAKKMAEAKAEAIEKEEKIEDKKFKK